MKALMGPGSSYAGDHVELSDGRNDFASSYGVGAVLSTKFTYPSDPPGTRPGRGNVLTPEKEVLWKKWVELYKQNMLPTGEYRGELYDIGFDKPETHVVSKGETLHYAFYADQWNGTVELRGLGGGRYRITDPFTGVSLGSVDAPAQHDRPGLREVPAHRCQAHQLGPDAGRLDLPPVEPPGAARTDLTDGAVVLVGPGDLQHLIASPV